MVARICVHFSLDDWILSTPQIKGAFAVHVGDQHCSAKPSICLHLKYAVNAYWMCTADCCVIHFRFRFIDYCSSQQTRDVEQILVSCWATVCDAGPTWNQYWFIVPCLLGCKRTCNANLDPNQRLFVINTSAFITSIYFMGILYFCTTHFVSTSSIDVKQIIFKYVFMKTYV